jgi:hypothetical protein
MDRGKMIAQVQGYFVLTAIFLLLFLGAASLVEKYKNVIPLKVSWDTLTNIFSTWFFIICFRKTSAWQEIRERIKKK